MVRETGGAATNVNSVLEGATANLFLRLDRNAATEQITGFYSLNGTTWISLGSVTQALQNPRLAIVVGASPGGTPNADLAWAEVIGTSVTPPRSTLPPRPTAHLQRPRHHTDHGCCHGRHRGYGQQGRIL